MARQRAPGWWYPWIFVGGMLVVVAVNAVMITLAVGTFPGLETENAYRKGLAYNQTIAAADAQVARGWQLDVSVHPQPSDPTATENDQRSSEITATFSDRRGDPLAGLVVEARFVRPTHKGNDLASALNERAVGQYVSNVAIPLPGQWDVRILARRGNETFQATRRIVVP